MYRDEQHSLLTKNIKYYIDRTLKYLNLFSKWVISATLIGILCGLVGTAFHKCVELATELRLGTPWLLYLLPLAGVLIAFIYRKTGMIKNGGTNNVISSVRTSEYVPMRLAPVIFITTVITHLFGGSAGREGAALQLGGSIGFQTGRLLKIPEKDKHLLVICGMSGVFSALFGTPVTAAIFSIEVISVGVIYYSGFLPGLTCASVAYAVSLLLGAEPTRFAISAVPELSLYNMAATAAIGAAAAVISIIFCLTLKGSAHVFNSKIKNDYLRPFVGGCIVIVMTLIVGNRDYNGSGVNIIEKAMNGEAFGFAFLLKIIFTAVTIGSGFRGGEIVPTMFIGSTLGCTAAHIIGFNPCFGAALGIAAMFCGVVNCPMASLALAAELFGGGGILFFAAAISVSYVLSGYYGLYSSQKIMYSKLHAKFINRDVI